MRLAKLFALAVTVPLSSCGIVNSYVYQPPSGGDATPVPPHAERVRVETADGLTLAGLAVPAQAGHPTLLVFNGNASTPTEVIDWFRPLTEAGYGLVAAGYRSYFGNPGRPNEAGLAADADAFFAEARRRAGSGPLIVVGHSLGGGVAFGLARRQPVDQLVTIGTFSRLRAMAPGFARPLLRDRYDNLAAVPGLGATLTLIHATDDDVIPVTEARLLHEAAVAAGLRGGTYLLPRGGHAPDGEQILTILDRLGGGAPENAAPLPAGVRFLPFR
ncbi:hypothetical protein GGR88_000869 [Sphingomonas jejuensis]|uniref:AB hydrolase-1 domain-containing protein n=1 Tax=Sphingomonas jejuensis TaxID=904715 RepID=A0ABX0XKZ4_9SPHN|nr:alpha/beta hydrolase [Sphingomonas jejuensis]NJC33395.1 hypothetical protein [Sphingomonas jejuensis]